MARVLGLYDQLRECWTLNLVSELLGCTDPKVTIEHDRRTEHVNPLTAELFDAAFAREDEGRLP